MKRDEKQQDLASRLEIPSVVPDLVNARIDHTLQNLEQRKRSRRLTKKSILVLAACLTIISLGTLAAFGQNLPLLNSLVKMVNPAAAQNYERVKVDISGGKAGSAGGAGKTAVHKTATDQGITLTVNDLAYDGASLIIGFELSKAGGFGNDVVEIDTDLLPSFQNPEDGRPANSESLVADSYLTPKDNGDYQGYAAFHFGDPAPNIEDNGTLTLTASNIGVVDSTGFKEVNGLWKIETGLTGKDIYTAAQITESGLEHPLKNGKVESVKLIRSALNNMISLKGYATPSTGFPAVLQGFFILDDRGNCLNYRYILREFPRQTGLAEEGSFNTVISLMRIPADTQRLTVIPYTSVKGKESKVYAAELQQLPVSIPMQDQEMTISAVERGQEKLTIHYTVSGFEDNKAYPSFEFVEQNGGKIPAAAQTGRRMNPMDYETGLGIYEWKTDRAQDIAKVLIHSQEYDLQKDLAFDLDLTEDKK
ncbi:hypothetical protein Sgly_1141 [Syntrophobotulus glycolicus DSM 8271]|uniref:DUF4179 domain-containing protein n=1 Tax=Syntrophobotulus glycolicus (strain DSM 8271 / FlGlyR) TaxID=645991 RepID=F0SU82_SYNGF|nr:DUF4179 domain-containing protein [Syntrophobotulus glycolicus]ADY55465.1 hypothetical protein Sgly_1141 [Syntrophobotulus glycolicus DSM 8271]